MTFTEIQKAELIKNLQVLLTELVDLATNKNIVKIFEALYKLKSRFQHETQIQQIEAAPIDHKAIKAKVTDILSLQ